jgi:acetyl esterase/lipase
VPLDEATQAFIAQASKQPSPPPGQVPLDQFRAAVAALAPLGFEAHEGAGEMRDIWVPGPGHDVRVRLYRPATAGPHPLLVGVHGGSWVRITIDLMDGYYQTLANKTGCAIAGVDYTLSPEAQFPTALEESYAVAMWAQSARDELGCRPDRLGIMGESSGGNMAAALALMARDRGELHFTSQVLVLPVLDVHFQTESWDELGSDYLLPREQLEWAVEQYAPGVDRDNPLLSPLLADDLSGLPPTLIVTGEFDPLRDEGERYAERLRDAGVEVDSCRVDGLIHHALMVPKVLPVGLALMDQLGIRIAALESAPTS